MDNQPTSLDPQRQQKAKEYSRISRRLMLVDLSVGGIYAIAWLAFGWSIYLRDLLLGLSRNDWVIVAGFGAVFGGFYLLISLPLGYYEGFILPHRFEQSTETLRDWILDQVKGALVGIIIGGLLLEVVYTVLCAAPQSWWLWAGFVLLFFNVLLAILAPVFLLPLFNKFVPLGEEHSELANRLVALADRAGTHIQGVYAFDMSRRTRAANAALTGLGKTRRVILGDTLLREFSMDEVETVMAHEIGHQVNRDIPIGILVSSILTIGGLYLASLGLRWSVNYYGFESAADVAAMPLFIMVMGLYSLVTMPLSNLYSRWRETLADGYALSITGKPKDYASALTRLANQNLADVDPDRWVELLLHSHPALNRRIAMAESEEKKCGLPI